MSYNNGPRIVTNGLVLCLDAGNSKSYPESGASWNDLSGNGNNGTLTNGPTYSSSNKGSIAFDGINDNVPLSSTSTQMNLDYISICSWVKANVATNGYIISANFNGGVVPFSLNIKGNNSPGQLDGIAFFIGGSWKNSGMSSDIRGDNKWHYIAGTFNGTTLSLYIDNVLDSSSLEGSGLVLPKNTAIPTIGLYSNDNAYFGGLIGSIKIYNRTLLIEEIKQNYNATKGRYNL